MHVEIGRQLAGVGSLLPLCGSRCRAQADRGSKCLCPLSPLTERVISCVEMTEESFTLEQPETLDSVGLKGDRVLCGLGLLWQASSEIAFTYKDKVGRPREEPRHTEQQKK